MTFFAYLLKWPLRTWASQEVIQSKKRNSNKKMYHLQQSSTFFCTLVTFNSSPIWLPGKKGSTTKFFLSSWQLEKLEIFFQKHNFPWRSFCTLGPVLSLLFLSIGWNCQRKQSQFFRSPRKWDKILSKQHLTPVVINRLSCSVWWISVTSLAMWGDNRSRFHHFVVTTQISQNSTYAIR